MTVSRHRRRSSTTRAVIATLVVAALAVGIGAGGYRVVVNTTDGQVVGAGASEVRFPATPTSLLAITGADGELASAAVLVARPGDGDDPARGGTVVPLPISADSSGGFGTERLPLNETVSLFGTSSLADEVSLLLGVEIDETTVLGTEELAAVLAPIGSIDVDLPSAVTDDGDEVVEAGAQALSADRVAAVLGAVDPTVTGAQRYPVDVAVWRGIAGGIGGGLEQPLETEVGTTSGATVTTPPSDRSVLSTVSMGPVAVQPLRSTPIASIDDNPRGVDAEALDRSEVLLVFGHIAPGKVDAPNAGYNFRVVSRFSDDQLAPGVDRRDVAYTAIDSLLAADANVVSVDTAAEEADAVTTVEVDSELLVDAAESLDELFGPIAVEAAGQRIAGVDVTVVLGTDYLARLEAAAPSATAVTAPSSATEGVG